MIFGNMFETPATQKAYEVSYATFRVAALVRRPDLKERLERQAAAVLEKAASGELDIHDHLEALRALIMLAEGVGEIRYVNAKVLLRELGKLELMAKERAAAEGGVKEEEFDIEKMFSTPADKAEVESAIRQVQKRNEAERQVEPAKAYNSANNSASNSASETRQSGNAGENGNGNGEARASVIYSRVQRGNASIKDLIAEFGNGVSERTLRYDLQRLVEQGKIERVGSGGPGTYYRQREVPLISETTLH